MDGPEGRPLRAIVYYDGDCALCNWSVAACLHRGVPRGVRFAPQDGESFERLVAARPELAGLQSIVLQVLPSPAEPGRRAARSCPTSSGLSSRPTRLKPTASEPGPARVDAGADPAPGAELRLHLLEGEPGEIKVRSEAVLWLAARLRGPERWLAAALWLAPRAVLDLGYRLLARNRQRVGRRLAGCPVPTPEQRRYFLA